MQYLRLHVVMVVGVFVAAFAQESMAQPSPERCEDDGNFPKLCVRFDNSPNAPVEDFDFAFNLTDPTNPGVDLIKGRDGAALLQWRVWSKDSLGNPANMGPVKIDATAVDDFDVKILSDSGGAGAVNVGGINLDPSDAANFSNLSSATITGTLSGTTWLQRSRGGVGGDVTGALTIDTISGLIMVIEGDVLAPMTVSTVSSLLGVVIQGNLGTSAQSADLDITTLAAPFKIEGDAGAGTHYGDITVGNLSGVLFVGGTVPSGHTVTIQNLKINDDFGGLTVVTLAGRMELMNGIPSSCPVEGPCLDGATFAGVAIWDLTGTGVIDLNGADVAGTLGVTVAQNNSQIIAGGAVSGFIYPGFTQSGFFNGTVTVSSVSEIGTLPTVPTGEIEAFSGAALNGTVIVNGINAGVIEASGAFTGQINVGSVAATGAIETAQSALGNIVVSGACSGAIEIGGDLTGTVDIDGALTSTGSVTVDGALKTTLGYAAAKILVDGICDGSIAIGEQTDTPTLIHLLGGLDNGSIEINTSLGSTFNADGDIRVGPTHGPMTDIVFDGCIHIYEGASGGGALNGTLIVHGCHATTHDLDICIDGPHNNNVKIVQPGCTNQVDWSCPAPPCP